MIFFKKYFHRLATGLKHFIHGIGFLYLGIRERRKNIDLAINCYPRCPLPFYTLWNMAQVCGFQLMNHTNSDTKNPTILFKDSTFIESKSLPDESSRWINGRCLDIRKSTVAKIFTDITHQDFLVNPTEFHGRMVEKSEKNYAHDGKIIEGPIAYQDSEKVYERLIDNEIPESHEVEDLRTIIVGSTIPLVYKIRRDRDERFEGYGSHTVMTSVNEVFSKKEQEQLIEFAKQIGLDFGEMDVLRDQKNKLIYVVDVNKTTVSPPADLKFKEKTKALQTIGKTFEEAFFNLSINQS